MGQRPCLPWCWNTSRFSLVFDRWFLENCLCQKSLPQNYTRSPVGKAVRQANPTELPVPYIVAGIQSLRLASWAPFALSCGGPQTVHCGIIGILLASGIVFWGPPTPWDAQMFLQSGWTWLDHFQNRTLLTALLFSKPLPLRNFHSCWNSIMEVCIAKPPHIVRWLVCLNGWCFGTLLVLTCPLLLSTTKRGGWLKMGMTRWSFHRLGP